MHLSRYFSSFALFFSGTAVSYIPKSRRREVAMLDYAPEEIPMSLPPVCWTHIFIAKTFNIPIIIATNWSFLLLLSSNEDHKKQRKDSTSSSLLPTYLLLRNLESSSPHSSDQSTPPEANPTHTQKHSPRNGHRNKKEHETVNRRTWSFNLFFSFPSSKHQQSTPLLQTHLLPFTYPTFSP